MSFLSPLSSLKLNHEFNNSCFFSRCFSYFSNSVDNLTTETNRWFSNFTVTELSEMEVFQKNPRFYFCPFKFIKVAGDIYLSNSSPTRTQIHLKRTQTKSTYPPEWSRFGMYPNCTCPVPVPGMKLGVGTRTRAS